MTSFSQAKHSLVLTVLIHSIKPQYLSQEHFQLHTSYAALFQLYHYIVLLGVLPHTQKPFSRRLERKFTSCYCSYSHLHQLLRGWKSPTTHQCVPALRHPNASLGNMPPIPTAVQLGVEWRRAHCHREWPVLPCQNKVAEVTKSDFGLGSRHETSGLTLVWATDTAGSHTSPWWRMVPHPVGGRSLVTFPRANYWCWSC